MFTDCVVYIKVNDEPIFLQEHYQDDEGSTNLESVTFDLNGVKYDLFEFWNPANSLNLCPHNFLPLFVKQITPQSVDVYERVEVIEKGASDRVFS